MAKKIVAKEKRRSVIYTTLTFVLLVGLFLSLALYLYTDTEERAMESLHVQTKQIKDDLELQLLSDRENLVTMASFAAKLYSDGDDYSLLFESFKPIGLISTIGILTEDNVFITQSGTTDLSGQVSFADEAAKGAYFSGRVKALANGGDERVRSAVPITVNGEVVGILFGIIPLDRIEGRYIGLATELDAQLFIFEASTGDLLVDSVHEKPGNISFLKDRHYNDGYSYEEFYTTDKGFSSFRSAYRDEDVLLHYSAIESLGWKIALVRYDSQVYAETHALLKLLAYIFSAMVIVMSLFAVVMTGAERRKNRVIDCASSVRKILIEASGNNNNNNNNIEDALKIVGEFTRAKMALFFDTNEEDYRFVVSGARGLDLSESRMQTLKAELFRYVSALTATEVSSLKVVRMRADKQLEKSHPTLYAILKEYDVSELVFSATVDQMNHITILCVLNPKRKAEACYIAEKISACFAIALSNHNILNMTRLAATTDSLTGVMNRVAYNQDLHTINEEKPFDFSCIYIDVNELHYRNNTFGHAAGDEMLVFIAHSLKDVFYGQKIYRMGGDEFLVFCHNLSQEDIKNYIDIFLEQLKLHDYHVAVGVSFRTQNTNTEEMVREAEVRMYDAKTKYYQDKEQQIRKSNEEEYFQVKTGIPEIDTVLSILKESYYGIYRVFLDTDEAKRVLMPSYLNYNEVEENFSKLFAKHISEGVDPRYHRALFSFQNYDVIKQQLREGKIPKITYKKLNGEMVVLSIYKLCDSNASESETLWVFAKK